MQTGESRRLSSWPSVGRHRTAGATYLGLLVLLAVASVWTATAVQVGEIERQRDAEEELLSTGREFTRALQLYASATPTGQPRAPSSLDDLLRDPRYPGVTRHLRRIPLDPMTGRSDWRVVRDPHGQILGIHSASRLKPIRKEGPAGQFPASETHWSSYADWVFWGAGGAATPL